MHAKATGGFARRLVLTLSVLSVLAACAPEPEEFGQCEPGVDNMSRVSTVVPPCP